MQHVPSLPRSVFLLAVDPCKFGATCSRTARPPHLRQSRSTRLQVQLRAAQRGHLLPHRRRSGHRAAQGRVLSSSRRWPTATGARPTCCDWRFVTPNRWPFEDNVAPAAVSDGDTLFLMQSAIEPAPDPLLHRSGDRPARVLQPPAAAAARRGAARPGPGAAAGRQAPAGTLGPGTVPSTTTAAGTCTGARRTSTRSTASSWTPRRRLAYKRRAEGAARRCTPSGTAGSASGRTIATANGNRSPLHGRRLDDQARGRYYLQYGAPGTEYNVYANGTYVGDSPLGPFDYAPYNPVAYKPGGFVTGAGHGTPSRTTTATGGTPARRGSAYNWNFERRIAMFPAGFDADGQMYVSTRFGDFPHCMPTARSTTRTAVHRLDAAVLPEAGGPRRRAAVRRRPRDRRESAHVLGRRQQPSRARR